MYLYYLLKYIFTSVYAYYSKEKKIFEWLLSDILYIDRLASTLKTWVFALNSEIQSMEKEKLERSDRINISICDNRHDWSPVGPE